MAPSQAVIRRVLVFPLQGAALDELGDQVLHQEYGLPVFSVSEAALLSLFQGDPVEGLSVLVVIVVLGLVWVVLESFSLESLAGFGMLVENSVWSAVFYLKRVNHSEESLLFLYLVRFDPAWSPPEAIEHFFLFLPLEDGFERHLARNVGSLP